MAIIERTADIAASVQQVYRASQDYAVRYHWDPFPERIEVVAGAPDSLSIGTRVRVRSKLGMRMLVEFVQVKPPTHAAIVMIDGPWFLAKFAGSWVFEATAANRTAARFRYSIVARPAFARWAIEPLATRYFASVVERRLAGLKTYCERLGDPVPSV
ncbi:SRPBCC family protein [Lysobacter sp. Root690]|uniref:SRPBCC family protein n=1 Tax=Lysobacter sp. Root690 TaxID=1736588 RepID=UPI0006F7B01F|nr:SRPBCC family protein [Lysobacter sp. Root690]KRB05003.1 polyketide cyclase/dehydrase [Lysobacter sp. Root690]